MTTLFDIVKQASQQVDNLGVVRSPSDVLQAAMCELGECSQEVSVDTGKSYKPQGVDGIVGEAFDVIACMLDMIHVVAPDMTEQQLIEYAESKMAKWVTKEREHMERHTNERLESWRW